MSQNQHLETGLVEIVVAKTYGQEQVSARVIVEEKDLPTIHDKLYKNLFTPRAESFADEVVMHQLKMDEMSREVQNRDKKESKKGRN